MWKDYGLRGEHNSGELMIESGAFIRALSICFRREHSIRVVKLLRAHGGCLGVRRL